MSGFIPPASSVTLPYAVGFGRFSAGGTLDVSCVFNIDASSQLGVGQYLVTLSAPLAGNNVIVTCSPWNPGGIGTAVSWNTFQLAVGAFQIFVFDPADTPVDTPMQFQVLGLA